MQKLINTLITDQTFQRNKENLSPKYIDISIDQYNNKVNEVKIRKGFKSQKDTIKTTKKFVNPYREKIDHITAKKAEFKKISPVEKLSYLPPI